MSELDATINVRTTTAKREAVDKAAAEMGMTRSEWLNKVIDDALRPMQPRGRRVVVQQRAKVRMITPGSLPSHLCSHPPQLRSEPHPVSGESICMACRSVFRPVR